MHILVASACDGQANWHELSSVDICALKHSPTTPAGDNAGSEHRMYLIDRTLFSATGAKFPGEDFFILGVSGNVYTVTISKVPRCTCPDAQKDGMICKHVFFVLLRVLQLEQRNPLVWQRALLKSEVRSGALLGGGRCVA